MYHHVHRQTAYSYLRHSQHRYRLVLQSVTTVITVTMDHPQSCSPTGDRPRDHPFGAQTPSGPAHSGAVAAPQQPANAPPRHDASQDSQDTSAKRARVVPRPPRALPAQRPMPPCDAWRRDPQCAPAVDGVYAVLKARCMTAHVVRCMPKRSRREHVRFGLC